jgi:hypothetical protein
VSINLKSSGDLYTGKTTSTGGIHERKLIVSVSPSMHEHLKVGEFVVPLFGKEAAAKNIPSTPYF